MFAVLSTTITRLLTVLLKKSRSHQGQIVAANICTQHLDNLINMLDTELPRY